MPNSTPNRSPRITIVDGGTGTTIEALGYDVSGPMWSSELVITDPAGVQGMHQGFADAGAEIHCATTYQMTPQELLRTYSSDETARILRSAIQLVRPATESCGGVIAASFGPFGASQQPGQEYAGIYPPPYGPVNLDPGSTGINAFPDTPEGRQAERAAQLALRDFHLAKLRILATDPDTWRQISWVAFETVPLFNEIRAIRAAMGMLRSELRVQYGKADQEEEANEHRAQGRAWWDRKFWIASAYPDGSHPQRRADGARVGVADVLEAMLGTLSRSSENEQTESGDNEEYIAPDGIGINCTNPSHIARLADEFTAALRAFPASSMGEKTPRPRPSFVLYPDGGATYDTATKTWTRRELGAEEWAKQVADVARKVESAEDGQGEKVWGGVIVGGCCKSSFDEIRALRRELDGEQP